MTIRNYLLSGLLLVLGYCLTACSEENYIPGEEAQGQPVSMQLQIGMASGEPLGPLTRAAGEIDTEPQDGELIHSLKVFITSTDNRVEQVVPFTFTSEQETAMAAGNLSGCTSDPFTILTGSKIIYAFANCDEVLDADLLNAEEGDVLSLPATITWDGGASWTPSADNGFIPMSVKQSVTISDHSDQVSVQLVRLLSKLYVSFHNTTSEAVTVSDWSVGKFNTAINLFRGDEIAALSSTPWSVPASTTESFTVSTSDDNTEPYLFYVSESAMNDGFEIHVTQGSGSDLEKKTRYTNRTEIPRNRIWPLAIYFSNFSLAMKIESENPPIGGYPTVMSDASDGVNCAIKGGGPFTLTPTLESTSSEAVPSQVTWNIVIGEENNNSLLVKDLKVEGNTITGVMEGAAEQEESYTFTLQAKDGSRVIAEFQVTLTFKDIFEN